MESGKNICCLNCEQNFNSEFQFCPHCGQANKKHNLNIKFIISELLVANFNLDSKIYLTLKLLVTQPGKLTTEFLSGKRTKYIPPVRLYLFISFVYFFAISINPNKDLNFVQTDDIISVNENSDTIIPSEIDSTTKEFELLNTAKDTTSNLYGVEDVLEEKSRTFNSDAGKTMFRNLFRKYVSLGMFLLIPATALLFFIFFRKGSYYFQHLIFSFHLQSLVFLYFIFFDLLDWVIKLEFLTYVKWGFFLIILFIWIKKYYRASTYTTIWKTIGFLISYLVVFTLFMIVVLLISFLNLDSIGPPS